MTDERSQSVLSLDALISRVEALKAEGKTIVTTNGCFDLMHIGHLRYLTASKAEGDVLVVLLNSDASVKMFKDDERPMVPQAERAELLAALRCVDYVTIFDQLTPIDALKALRPDVHTKGGQYTLETLPEAPELQAMGTRIAFIDMVDGKSTSQLIEKVLRAYGSSST